MDYGSRIPPQFSKIYFLKVTRKKGNGRTEGVEAFLSIKNRFDMISTLWWLPQKPETNITKFEYVVLFKLKENETKITFPSILYIPESQSYTLFAYNSQLDCMEYSNKKLVIEIEAIRGHIPKKQFKKTIGDIVQDARYI
jgi:hypothetical protein